MQTCLLRLSLFTIIAGFSTPAAAVDGVLEINQACAEETGCFAKDFPGFPVTLDGSAGSSYRLTSSLKLPNGDTTGILITGSGTTLDLNGFTIGCFPGICAAGAGYGIRADLSAPVPPTTVRVKNGTVQGVGSTGISLGLLSIVEDVVALANRGDGISALDYATIVRCRAVQNGNSGLKTGERSFVKESVVALNGRSGIEVGATSTVSENTASGNSLDGITATTSATISNNTVEQSGDIGILSGSGATTSGNSVRGSGSTGIITGFGSTVAGNSSYQNDGDGISAGIGSTVSGNTVMSNGRDGTGYGIRLEIDAAYRANTVKSNASGTVLGGVNSGGNVCNGSLTCP